MDLHWQIKNEYEPQKIKQFADELNSNPVLAKILRNRGIHDIETARTFFQPEMCHLHDPFLIAGMRDAVDRIQKAITENQKILIYGDYDVDGTTATSLLFRFFKYLNHPVDFHVPDRILDGYGLSGKGIEQAAQNEYNLIITVDCGVTAIQEIELARDLGMDVIICDHHQSGTKLPPAVAILNPKRAECSYPFKELAGVGVAFKLVQAIQQHLELDEALLLNLLNLVAIGSAADIVPLVDENRILVKFGLQYIRRTDNVGLRALVQSAGLDNKEIGTGQVVFMLAPRINAVGRLGDAGRAVRLLTTENDQQAKNIASILESENRIRRDIDEDTFLQAIEVVENNYDPQNERALVLNKDGWHPGVIGIVASRIVEKYFRPTIMIATEDGKGKGSARSIPGFDLYEALKSCKDLMIDFGGHKYAAGLSIKLENIPQLRERFNEIASENLTDDMLIPKLSVDAEIQFSEITWELLKLLNKMAPFGPQNMRPVFMSKDLEVVGTPTIVGKNHLKFKVRQDGIVMDAIGFNLGDKLYRISCGEHGVDMVYVLDENEWQGRKKIQLRVKDLR